MDEIKNFNLKYTDTTLLLNSILIHAFEQLEPVYSRMLSQIRYFLANVTIVKNLVTKNELGNEIKPYTKYA